MAGAGASMKRMIRSTGLIRGLIRRIVRGERETPPILRSHAVKTICANLRDCH
jgi:hypothetical protein